MTIGQRIQQIRISAGLTQEEFGAYLGTTRQTVSRWELDMTFPELDRIVRMSRRFSVSTDSILVDGITSFDTAAEDEEAPYPCGVYRSDTVELVETERVAIQYGSDMEDRTWTVRVYTGFACKKTLRAYVQHTVDTQVTAYAYRTEGGGVVSNNDKAVSHLGEPFDRTARDRLYRCECFSIAHDSAARRVPTVPDAGLRRCLLHWRMATKLRADTERFTLTLCTSKTEYAVDIEPRDENIYCAASFNTPTDMGLFCGEQFFRIRRYKDNTAPFCGCFAHFGLRAEQALPPTAACVGGTCVTTEQGLFCGVKRYTEREIVLAGCGGDEYIYRADDPVLERLTEGEGSFEMNL